jgi:hypothetical protein
MQQRSLPLGHISLRTWNAIGICHVQDVLCLGPVSCSARFPNKQGSETAYQGRHVMQPTAPIRNGKCIEGQRRVQYLDVLRHDNDNDGGIPNE